MSELKKTLGWSIIWIFLTLVAFVAAIFAGLAYYNVQEQMRIERLPETSSIRRALAAKMEWKKKEEKIREAKIRAEEAQKKQEEYKQTALKLADKLRLKVASVTTGDALRAYPSCARPRPLWNTWVFYYSDNRDCILIEFVERAKNDSRLMKALKLSSAAQIDIRLDTFFGWGPNYITIDADADNQTIINHLTVNAVNAKTNSK